MLANLTGFHLIILLAIVLLLFGAPGPAGGARSVAQSMRIFRTEVRDDPETHADGEAEPSPVVHRESRPDSGS